MIRTSLLFSGLPVLATVYKNMQKISPRFEKHFIPNVPEKEEMLKEEGKITVVSILVQFFVPQGEIPKSEEELYKLRKIGKASAKYFPEYGILEIWDCYTWEKEAPPELKKGLIEEFVRICRNELLINPEKIYLHEEEPAYEELGKSYSPLVKGEKKGEYLLLK